MLAAQVGSPIRPCSFDGEEGFPLPSAPPVLVKALSLGGDDDHRVHPDRPGNCARTRHEPSADSRDPPGRVSQRSTHLIVTAWPRSRSSRQSNSSDEIPSLHWPLPPLIAGRKLASFACPISPGFSLNCDLPIVNVRANWLCFGAFRSSPAPCLRLH